MAEIVKRDESIMSEKDRDMLNKTLTLLEKFYPEHKIYAMLAICREARENSNKLARILGYESTEDFLTAYGYEVIKGDAVYEIRKGLYTDPGNEPEEVRARVVNSIQNLEDYYPSREVPDTLKGAHKKLNETLTGLYQWLGYETMGDMLAAYGFKYSSGKTGRPSSVDPEAIIAELRKRYPDGTEMTAAELKAANPDLKIKSLMNQSKELFGKTFADYLLEQGIIRKHIKTAEEIEEEQRTRLERKKEQEYQQAIDDLSAYETYYQNASLGWSVLPDNSEKLFKDNSAYKSKKRIDNIVNRFGFDPDDHFRKCGVLSGAETDNEFRSLIQYINFDEVARATGLKDVSGKRLGATKTVEVPDYLGIDLFADRKANEIYTIDDSSNLAQFRKDVSEENDGSLSDVQLECLNAIKSIAEKSPVVTAAEIVLFTGRAKSTVSVALGTLGNMGYINVGDNGWISLKNDSGNSGNNASLAKNDVEIEAWINGLEVTSAQKEYLLTIADIAKKAPVVRAIDIGNALGKSRSTVSTAIKNLKTSGYIKVDSDKGWISLNIE